MTRGNIEKGKLAEATNLLVRFKLLEHFDIKDVIMKCIISGGKIGCVKELVNEVPSVLEDIIHKCSTKELHKTASQLVKDYKLDIKFYRIKQIVHFKHSLLIDYRQMLFISQLLTMMFGKEGL